jgi:predicted DCC family thiol-disulfide oxidoreductase YuxK
MTIHVFAAARLLLGAYLVGHFLVLWPDAPELFSHMGMLKDASSSPTWRIFPNWFWLTDAPWMVHVVMGVAMTGALLLMAGVRRRWMAFLLWTVWETLLNRNLLISNPSLPFIGLALLWMAAHPSGEPWARDPVDPAFRVVPWAHRGLLLVLMAGYTISGLHKLGSPSWQSGHALSFVLQLPLARDHALRLFLLDLPTFVLQGLTYFALLTEILALPLTLWPKAQRWIWALLLTMNLVLLLLVDFADLTMGMVVFHALCMRREWWPAPTSAETHPTVFFDGVCNLCNGVVRFLLAENVERNLRFAPLQGTTAQTIDPVLVRELSSLVFRDGEHTFLRSDAALRIALSLGGVWTLGARVGLLVPRRIRDWLYDEVAGRRYSLFGRRDACRVPTAEERARFLP